MLTFTAQRNESEGKPERKRQILDDFISRVT